MKFGALLGVFPARETVELGILAEKVGYDSVWIADHLTDFRLPAASWVDPWTVLGALGEHTRRILFSTAVSPYQYYHPAKLAQHVASLDELSNGRAMIGMGTGENMSVTPFGIEWEKLNVRRDRLREAIQVMRLLWASSWEKTVNFHGKYYRLINARLDQAAYSPCDPPVYIGALVNEQTLRLVGELGDGWIPWVMCPELYAKNVEIIKSGAEKVGRKIEDIDLAVWLQTAVTEDPEIEKDAKKVLRQFMMYSRYPLKMLGYEIRLPAKYSYIYGLPTAEVAKVIGEAAEKIPDEVVEKAWEKGFFAVGSTEEIIEIVEKYIRAGATHICIRDGIFKNNPMGDTLRAISEKVMPYFREDP